MPREHPSTVRELFDPLTPLSLATVALAGVVLLAVGVALLGGLPGCTPISRPIPAHLGDVAAPSMAGEFAYVGWLAAISLTIGVVTLVLSFWVPLIPTKGSIACVLLSVALWGLKYALEKYLHIAVTLGVIIAAVAGAVALFPLAHTWINAHISGAAKKLAATDPKAAAVLAEVADGGLGLEARLKNLSLSPPAGPAR